MSYASESFGFSEIEQHIERYKPSCKKGEIESLTKELKDMRKQYKKASLQEQHSIRELQNILRDKLKRIPRTEWRIKWKASIE